MAIHFKPISNLSNLIFLGIFLLVVQLQNSAVEAGDENLGHRHVRAALDCNAQNNLCQTLGCDCVQDTDNDGPPFCKCTVALDTSSKVYTDANCNPAKKDSGKPAETTTDTDTTITPEICLASCKKATADAAADAEVSGIPSPPYTATVCTDGDDTKNCVCIPGGLAEENVDALIETAKAVISGLVNAIVTFVQDLVKALVDLVTALANLPLADILTGLVGSLKGIVGNIAGGEDSE